MAILTKNPSTTQFYTSDQKDTVVKMVGLLCNSNFHNAYDKRNVPYVIKTYDIDTEHIYSKNAYHQYFSKEITQFSIMLPENYITQNNGHINSLILHINNNRFVKAKLTDSIELKLLKSLSSNKRGRRRESNDKHEIFEVSYYQDHYYL